MRAQIPKGCRAIPRMRTPPKPAPMRFAMWKTQHSSIRSSPLAGKTCSLRATKGIELTVDEQTGEIGAVDWPWTGFLRSALTQAGLF